MMKRETPRQHKELALLCEERISKLERQSFQLLLQVSRIVETTINESIACKRNMYYTNCHYTNHNTEACCSKQKEELTMVMTKVSGQVVKLFIPMPLVIYVKSLGIS